MRARIRSLCPICGEAIKVGDEITRGATGRWVHYRCFAGVAARAVGSKFFAPPPPWPQGETAQQGQRDEMSVS